MARVRISEAARLAGVSKSTMHRALRAGRVSFETDERGERWIDPAEVARAYSGTARAGPRQDQRHAVTRPEDRLVEQLLRQIEDLQQQRDKLMAQCDRLMALVEQREQRLLPAPRRWWEWWRR